MRKDQYCGLTVYTSIPHSFNNKGNSSSDPIMELFMTTFVLKKYEEKPIEPISGVKPEEDKTTPPKKEELMIEIKATDTIAKIVATALYKALPNNVLIEEAPDAPKSEADTAAISTEDINRSPADCLKQVKNGSSLLIMNEGFKTEKEEWFLSSMGPKRVNVFYSLESFVQHVRKTLGV